MNQNNIEGMQYKVKGLDSILQVMEKPVESRDKQARDKIRSVPKKTTLVVVRRQRRET